MLKIMILGFISIIICATGGFCEKETKVEIIDIMPVWSGHPVGFSLFTSGQRQYVAFYDAQRQMTIGARELDSDQWQFVQLPETLGWDSHNSVTLTVDDDGRIHVAGNMHVKPLVYFRTMEPHDITTFEKLSMVGEREEKVTYPRFKRGPNNEFIFTYRDGHSGKGDQIYNIYDHETQTWKRFIDQPLLSGGDDMNAYFFGPVFGPDGYYHMCWVWRDHSGCEMNHDLSYARSADMIHWEKGNGEAIELPITIHNGDIVDPVPVRGGMINGNTRLGFDSKKRPVISYHKFDEEGNTQIYNARLEDGTWAVYQTSDWDYRWDFRGGGCIVFEVRVGRVSPAEEGKLKLGWNHKEYGAGEWILEEEDFSILSTKETKPVPKEGTPPDTEGDFPGLEVRWCGDSGRSEEPGVYYRLRWETLGPNRDKPREGELPPPSMLRLHRFEK